jgi:hypothetical protein
MLYKHLEGTGLQEAGPFLLGHPLIRAEQRPVAFALASAVTCISILERYWRAAIDSKTDCAAFRP